MLGLTWYCQPLIKEQVILEDVLIHYNSVCAHTEGASDCGISSRRSAANALNNRSPTTSDPEDVWVVTKPVISVWFDTHRLCRVETTMHERVTVS